MDENQDRLNRLRTKDWWSRKKEIEELAAGHEERHLAVLESWLRKGEDHLSRNIAMEVFRALGSGATAFLVSLLSDSDADIRIFAANLIGDIGDKDALTALIETLEDTDLNVRIAAIEALGKMGDARAVGVLARRLEDSPWSVMAAVDALGRIGGDEARTVLHRFLVRGEYRGMTCEALERAGDRASVEQLMQYVGRGEIGGLALRALVTIAERECVMPSPLFIAETLPVLKDLVQSPDAAVRRAALIALSWAGKADAAPCLIAALGDDGLQEHAINGLMALGRDAVPDIIGALRGRGGQRGILAKILSMTGEVHAFPEFAGDADSEVRTEAALALGTVNTPEAKALLVKLSADPVDEVKAAAVLSLQLMKGGAGNDGLSR